MTSTQRFTLGDTSLGLLTIYLDALIVNVALPAIQSDFKVGQGACSGWSQPRHGDCHHVVRTAAVSRSEVEGLGNRHLDRDRKHGHRDRAGLTRSTINIQFTDL
jgi:hypothetical protein